MRKKNGNHKLAALTDAQYATLCDRLVAGMTLMAAAEFVESEFGITVSKNVMARFYQENIGQWVLARRQRACGIADQVAAELERNPGQLDRATIDLIRQRAFELSSNPQADPKAVASILSLVLKVRDQDQKDAALALDRRRLELLEAKEQAAQEAKSLLQTVSRGGLTPETLATIERAAQLL